ncbi:hypothetical protein F5Y15DRAFT_411623 [Xylariaceae sp. FL0016]|nr:hypothetical protein F5Y15DRAFT_411623 [Xylariaceae sp. FL0016]
MTSRILAQSSRIARPARSFIAARAPISARTFTSNPISLKQKESSDVDSDPSKHKDDLLSKQKAGKGHWKPELASDSEEAVKADRAGEEDVQKLQERTKNAAEETKKAGTSMRDGL